MKTLTPYKKQTITGILGIVILLVAFLFLNNPTQAVELSDPCLKEMTRDNSIREVEQFIGDCELTIEQTGLDADEKAKAMQLELDELKVLNDTRRDRIKKAKEELLGN